MEVYYPINWSAFFAHLATDADAAVAAAVVAIAIFFYLCGAIFPFSFSILSAGFCCCLCSCVLLLENDSSCVSLFTRGHWYHLIYYYYTNMCHGVLVGCLLICFFFSKRCFTILFLQMPANIDLVQNWSVLRLYMCQQSTQLCEHAMSDYRTPAQSATLRQITLLDAFFSSHASLQASLFNHAHCCCFCCYLQSSAVHASVWTSAVVSGNVIVHLNPFKISIYIILPQWMNGA